MHPIWPTGLCRGGAAPGFGLERPFSSDLRPATGLMHAVDIFPTLLLGAAGLTRAIGRKPLDGLDLWAALKSNSTSPRKDVRMHLHTQKSRRVVPCKTAGSLLRLWLIAGHDVRCWCQVYIGVSELYIGLHGPAIRDAAGWKLILNGGGGVGGWNMTPGSGGARPQLGHDAQAASAYTAAVCSLL